MIGRKQSRFARTLAAAIFAAACLASPARAYVGPGPGEGGLGSIGIVGIMVVILVGAIVLCAGAGVAAAVVSFGRRGLASLRDRNAREPEQLEAP